jgi:hypothetical protein
MSYEMPTKLSNRPPAVGKRRVQSPPEWNLYRHQMIRPSYDASESEWRRNRHADQFPEELGRPTFKERTQHQLPPYSEQTITAPQRDNVARRATVQDFRRASASTIQEIAADTRGNYQDTRRGAYPRANISPDVSVQERSSSERFPVWNPLGGVRAASDNGRSVPNSPFRQPQLHLSRFESGAGNCIPAPTNPNIGTGSNGFHGSTSSNSRPGSRRVKRSLTEKARPYPMGRSSSRRSPLAFAPTLSQDVIEEALRAEERKDRRTRRTVPVDGRLPPNVVHWLDLVREHREVHGALASPAIWDFGELERCLTLEGCC